MQKLEGDGWVFVHAGGTVVHRELKAGERLDVDTGCVVAFHDTVSMDVRPVGGIKSMLFGGEGVFLATLPGPGTVALQRSEERRGGNGGVSTWRSRVWPCNV